MIIRITKLLFIIISIFLAQYASANEFEIEDIVIEGLDRIEPGTVFTYMPVKLGDKFKSSDSSLIFVSYTKPSFLVMFK